MLHSCIWQEIDYPYKKEAHLELYGPEMRISDSAHLPRQFSFRRHQIPARVSFSSVQGHNIYMASRNWILYAVHKDIQLAILRFVCHQNIEDRENSADHGHVA